MSQMTTDIFHFCFSFMTYHRVCNYINTTGSTSEAGIAYPSGASEFTSICSGVRVTRSVVLCVCFVDVVCPLVLFLLAIVLSVLLQFTNSDYPFGIFKLFLSLLALIRYLFSLSYSVSKSNIPRFCCFSYVYIC